jgi:hypothetical protein
MTKGKWLPSRLVTLADALARIRDALCLDSHGAALAWLRDQCEANHPKTAKLVAYVYTDRGSQWRIWPGTWGSDRDVNEMSRTGVGRSESSGGSPSYGRVVFERAELDALLAPAAAANGRAQAASAGRPDATSPAEPPHAAPSPPSKDWRDASLPEMERLALWFLATIAAGWSGTYEDWYREAAVAGFDDVADRAFREIWDRHATAAMKKPGRKRRSMPESDSLRYRRVDGASST